MSMKLMTAGMIAILGLTAFCGGIQISNVKASQRSKDTGSVDITFDLSSDSNKVSVVLSALNSDNNQTVAMNAVYDDEGNFLGNPAKIEPGNGRHLVWNSALDLGKGFYSSSMVVTVRATEGDLPLSVTELHEVTKSNCIQARAQAKVALADAEAKLTEAQANQATVSDAALQAAVTNLQAQQVAILTGNDAWLAISNMYFRANTKAVFDASGFQMGYADLFGAYDWGRSFKANNNLYGTSGGATNAVVAAGVVRADAYAAVYSNADSVVYTVGGNIGGVTLGALKYGSKELAAYVTERIAKMTAVTDYIVISADRVAPADGADAEKRKVEAVTGFASHVKTVVDVWAKIDAAWLDKKEDELTAAKENYDNAYAAMKAVFDKDVQIAADIQDATANWNNRKSLQATAELAVRNAEDAVKSAEASYNKAKMACDSLGL